MGFLAGFLIGLLTFIGFLAYRALRSGHWDSSNFLNVLRAISFLAVHPEVFPYLRNIKEPDSAEFKKKFPFWFLPHDEFKEVVTNTGTPDYEVGP